MDKREKIRARVQAMVRETGRKMQEAALANDRATWTAAYEGGTDAIMAEFSALQAGELVEAAQHRPRLNRDVSTRLREYAEAMEATAESEEDIEDAAGLLALLDWQEARGDQS